MRKVLKMHMDKWQALSEKEKDNLEEQYDSIITYGDTLEPFSSAIASLDENICADCSQPCPGFLCKRCGG